MNKQEFQQTIKNMKPPKFFTAITLNEAYEAGFEEAKGNALCNSCFLNEPEKPVVPQSVADFYESIKDDFEDGVYELCVQFYEDESEPITNLYRWFDRDDSKPIETLVKMKLFGYEVEKEKLYTVEIPNPICDEYSRTFLGKYESGKVGLYNWLDYTSIEFADNWKQEEYAQLTEAEIKKDFDWAWKYAEEVEE